MKLEDYNIRELLTNHDSDDRHQVEDLLYDIYEAIKIKDAPNILDIAAYELQYRENIVDFYIQTELRIDLAIQDNFSSIVTLTKKFSITDIEQMKSALTYVQFLAPYMNGNFHILCYLKSEDKFARARELSKKWVGSRKKALKFSKEEIDVLMSDGDVASLLQAKSKG